MSVAAAVRRPSALPPARFAMITLCLLGLGLSYVDRVNLAIAAPLIRKDLGLSDDSLGLVLGAFWTYALLQTPAGWFIDRVGARVGFAFAVTWWSLFTMATGLARSAATMSGARLLLGAGEAGAAPACVKVVYSWFPRSERGLAAGIFDAGPRAGTAIALPIVTACIGIWGWEASFYVTGLIGFAWLAAWLAIYREPETSRLLTDSQRRHLLMERAAPPGQGPVHFGRLSNRPCLGPVSREGPGLGDACGNEVSGLRGQGIRPIHPAQRRRLDPGSGTSLAMGIAKPHRSRWLRHRPAAVHTRRTAAGPCVAPPPRRTRRVAPCHTAGRRPSPRTRPASLWRQAV